MRSTAGRTAEREREALHQDATMGKALAQGYVQCTACEHWCALAPGAAGKCGVRRNEGGRLVLLVYGKAIAAHVDPIEKKPLHHFLPGSSVFSIGTLGCNLTCAWCQNWEISQHRRFDPATDFIGHEWLPEQIVAACTQHGLPSVAFTYNEPAVYFEYACDTARLAHATGLRTVFVSSGFETVQALDAIAPYLAAANVDLKAFRDATYREYCGARLGPVKRNIRHLVEAGVWTEVTTLVIPELNDSDGELSDIAAFLAEIGPDIPWHVSAFTPHYHMHDHPPTPSFTLRRAWAIGKAAGLHHVYTGNVWGERALEGCTDTLCPACAGLVIRRRGYRAATLWREPGICPRCGGRVAGIWV